MGYLPLDGMGATIIKALLRQWDDARAIATALEVAGSFSPYSAAGISC